ncbi:MAG: hypothetical protein NWQ44_01700 [Flavobacteriales bacterium]|jgi:hypothetical protein|nr:hypothetical protein [Flavobacteriales bacterium]MDP4716469.1 hypothetical protein [Flavobacteriales bacterium]MDP4730534.1 hypothetical protein [Flavobacteriales bacterium]MDP4819108.1 hypothetical protein [Flavobacteriales bacterium]MDP4950417.1 hypothetical protein [Flavobacteriales bacterium]
MKTLKFPTVFLMLLLSLKGFTQDGLEGIIVEKFYVSTKADNAGKLYSGDLPEGSVTYRIYVDLKPGYRFQAAYGSPQHPLVIESTENFYNHLENGNIQPNIIPERTYKKNISLLDSWLSAGACAERHLGILKEYDDTISDKFIGFEKGYFKGKKKSVPLYEVDGMKRSAVLPVPTFFQMDFLSKVIGTTTSEKRIFTDNGAWAALGKGAVGADSLSTNCVLIAQLTTLGELSFELNLLIGAPNGSSQKYVAKNPITEEGEWTHPDLIFNTEKRKIKTKKK